MRLSAQKRSDEIVLLNSTNYVVWRTALRIRWGKKGALTEDQKFCYLLEAITPADQVMIDRAMEAVVKKSGDTSSAETPTDKPYTWALQYLKERYGVDSATQRAEAIRLRGKLSQLSIVDGSYNLERYCSRFLRIVADLSNIGEPMQDSDLLVHFKDGCMPHQDLQGIMESIPANTALDAAMGIVNRHIESLKLAKEKSKGRGRDVSSGGRAYNALGRRESVRCSHCGKAGHSEAKCWQLHPEQKPKCRYPNPDHE
jgi:hypothetical protein